MPGALPKVGEPGATLGGRVIKGYGYPPQPERKPIKEREDQGGGSAELAQELLGQRGTGSGLRSTNWR
jgi:hypothetical protein